MGGGHTAERMGDEKQELECESQKEKKGNERRNMKRKIKLVCNRPIRKYLGDVVQKKRAEKTLWFRRDTRLSSEILSSSCFLDRPPPTVTYFYVHVQALYSYYSLRVLFYLKYPGACADTLPVFFCGTVYI